MNTLVGHWSFTTLQANASLQEKLKLTQYIQQSFAMQWSPNLVGLQHADPLQASAKDFGMLDYDAFACKVN